MKGRVLPELVAGKLAELITEFQTLAHQEDVCVSHKLSPGDRSFVLLELERSFQHMLYVLQLKTANWEPNPWKLPSLGHHAIEAAQTRCRLAYSMFQRLAPEEQFKEHRMTSFVLF